MDITSVLGSLKLHRYNFRTRRHGPNFYRGDYGPDPDSSDSDFLPSSMSDSEEDADTSMSEYDDNSGDEYVIRNKQNPRRPTSYVHEMQGENR